MIDGIITTLSVYLGLHLFYVYNAVVYMYKAGIRARWGYVLPLLFTPYMMCMRTTAFYDAIATFRVKAEDAPRSRPVSTMTKPGSNLN